LEDFTDSSMRLFFKEIKAIHMEYEVLCSLHTVKGSEQTGVTCGFEV
jgi:hypothetical protein